MTEEQTKIDPKVAEGCLVFLISLAPALGLCLVLMGVIKSFVVDSWLIAIGVGLLSAFPTLGYANKLVRKRIEKGEAKLKEQRDREQGIIEGGD